MARSKKGQAISERGRSPSARKRLRKFIRLRLKEGALDGWRRGRAVLGYIARRRVVALAVEAGVARSAVNRGLHWYEVLGVDGLLTESAPGPAPQLTEAQRLEVAAMVDAGPQAAGYSSGVWTGPMLGDLIEQRFQVRYHNHQVPRLRHELGVSLQRPRKRLARADAEKQATWLRQTFPAIKKKKPSPAEVA